MIDKFWDFVHLNRFLCYLGGFALFVAFDCYKDFVLWQFSNMQLEMLEASFKVQEAEEKGQMAFAMQNNLMSIVQGI